MVRIVLMGMRDRLVMRVGMVATERMSHGVESSDSGEGEENADDPCYAHHLHKIPGKPKPVKPRNCNGNVAATPAAAFN